MKTKDFPAVVESRKVVEKQINRYNKLMSKKDKKPKLFIVDTLVTFRHRYVVEGNSLEHAYDEVVMKDSGNEDDYFEEVTQRCLGEQILDGREIDSKEFKRMLKSLETDEVEMSSHWLGEKLIRKINYVKD